MLSGEGLADALPPSLIPEIEEGPLQWSGPSQFAWKAPEEGLEPPTR